MIKKTTLMLFFVPVFCFIFPFLIQAEMQTVISTARQPILDNQPPESVRFVTSVKAKRLALAKAEKYIKSLDLLKHQKLTGKTVMALATGVLATEIISQNNFTTDDAHGFEVSVKIELDTARLAGPVAKLMYDKDLLQKYRLIVSKESQLLSRINTLEEEHLTLVGASPEKKEALKQKYQMTASALSAVSLYKKALDLVNRESLTGRDVPEEVISYLHTAINLNPEYTDAFLWLGQIFSDRDAYGRAVEYYQRALVIDLKNLGENDPDMATAYNRLGLAFHRNAEYDRALEAYKKAWKVQIHTLGENHPDVATTYNNMGETYREMKDYDRAIEYYHKDLEISLNVLGRDHPNVAISYNNLAYAYYGKGENGRAIEYFQEALEICQVTFGENHPQTRTIQQTIEHLKSQN